MTASEEPAAACPVDHKTREAWLKHAQSQKQPENPHKVTPEPASSPLQTSCDSSQLDQSTKAPSILSSLSLGTTREVSTIPRSLPSDPPTPLPSQHSGTPTPRPANNEAETGRDAKSGNWIYPSEQMFFEAMKRKGYEANGKDMRTIVPIHNAVNERAWMEIKRWEKGRGAEGCGGPRLTAFSGLSTSLTPRARWKTLIGYQAPFDRHDWVVDRCGTQVEYVIDFYAGKNENKPGKELNFYLDVRPKLNSWEGVKMRIARFWGF